MPRYHFELANGHRLPDPGGLECSGDHDAMEKAKVIARTMAAELEQTRGRQLIVLNEEGAEIYKMPLRASEDM